MFRWLVISKNLKLSSALFLPGTSMLEEGLEILWIVLIMVLLTRCTFPSQPFFASDDFQCTPGASSLT